MEPGAGEAGTDTKIVAALERIGHAMRLLLWDAVKTRGLSPVQAQILLYLQGHGEDLGRVTHIAREFGLTPATVSDSVSALELKGLVQRQAWQGDARVVTLKLTGAGAAMARELEDWAKRLRESIADFAPREQDELLLVLMRLIERLQRRGVITVARMCITCRFFLRDAHPAERMPHHCALLDKPLALATLRLDCPDHAPVPHR
ncbi:MAG: MarR family transcriptional regulator [Dehalococcoidia bacterium]